MKGNIKSIINSVISVDVLGDLRILPNSLQANILTLTKKRLTTMAFLELQFLGKKKKDWR